VLASCSCVEDVVKSSGPASSNSCVLFISGPTTLGCPEDVTALTKDGASGFNADDEPVKFDVNTDEVGVSHRRL